MTSPLGSCHPTLNRHPCESRDPVSLALLHGRGERPWVPAFKEMTGTVTTGTVKTVQGAAP